MKRQIWLFVISCVLGICVTSPVATFHHTNHWQLPMIQLTARNAQADTLAPTHGTMADSDVTWTLKNGVLSLSGGTVTPYAASYSQVENGLLLYDLISSVSTDSSTYDALYTYFQNTITKVQLTGKLTLSKGTFSNVLANYFFAHLPNVTTFSGLDNLDVSDATIATDGLNYMFAYDTSLKTFTAPSLTDANSHPLEYMFAGDTALVNLDLSQLDNTHTGEVDNMFTGDDNLSVLNLSNWATPSTTRYLFAGVNLQNITLSKDMRLNNGALIMSSMLTGPTADTNFTGNWQSVGDGTVDFINNDPLQGYKDYDPQGDVLTNDQLCTRYKGDTALTGNETYVWEPTESYRFTTPDPVIPNPTPTPTPTTPTTPSEPDQATFSPFNVVATQKIGLYSTKNFSTASRLTWYVKKPQMKQPTFTVIGETKSTAGNARYHVRDLNSASPTYGQTGYITTNSAYVASPYYQSAPQTVTVINPKGLNSYPTAALSHPITHYRQGTQLTVKKVVTHNATTRFLLNDGTYISANKHLVTAGRQSVPTKVRAKTAVNRYATVNLTHKQQHYAAKSHHVFKVLGWDYSRGTSTTTPGTLRYRVAGGYITANPKFVTTRY